MQTIESEEVTSITADVIAEVLNSLKTKISSLNFNNWIKPTRFSLNDDKLLIEVPNKFIRDWITENYLYLIKYELFRITHSEKKIEFCLQNSQKTQDNVSNEVKEIKPEEHRSEKIQSEKIRVVNLNSKYHFNNFVVGNSNQFAHAACQAVATQPAKSYNPLFIYGAVGLGKTHLINAIGIKISQVHPELKVLYMHSEQFTNELISSIRYDKMFEFRKRFRESCDVLIIDDIQFIGGKERTQEEFFHTFNFLYESRKQIVLASDKMPKDIPQLEERLRSRFEWGLIADIQAPDVETRVAILQKKAESEETIISDDVLFHLANNIRNNVRELEGCLTRIIAFSSLTQTPISIELAKEVLKNVFSTQSQIITVESVQKLVAKHYNIKMDELLSARRLKTLAVPRQIAMYLCRKHIKASYPELGEKFGGKDHSTVVHAVRKIERMMQSDMELQSEVLQIEKQLN